MILLFAFLSQFVHAESLDKVRAGYDKFPVAECPEINKRYEDMAEKLSQLKTSIREKANCNDEKATFDGFAKLVTDDRAEFLQIAAKGAVNAEETKKVTAYVESVTKMGGTIVDLILGSSCFKDDNKNFVTVELVASMINEATSVLGKLKGPYGPLISMAGKISSTLLLSIDKIVRNRQARQAYDFNVPEQRKLFIQTMCSYAGFRREIDEISRVDAALRDVFAVQNAYQTQLYDIYKACPECKTLADRFVADFHKGTETYVRGTMTQVAEKFAAEVKQADDRFLEPIGSQTVINLRSLVWTFDELQRLDKNISDLGDVERDRVVQIQDVLEDFLFSKWHPELIKYYDKQLHARMTTLQRSVAEYLVRLGEMKRHQTWSIWPSGSLPPTEDMIQDLFEGPVTLKRSGFGSLSEINIFTRAAHAEVNRQIGEIVSAVVLIERHCEFVRAGNLKYQVNGHSVCHSETMTRAYDLLWALRARSHGDSPLIQAVYDAPRTTLTAWAEKRCVWLPRRDYVWTANPLQKMALLMREIHTRFPGFPLKNQ